MKRNSYIYIICFTLMASLAITFITAAGTAVLAGHCGKITAKNPFAVVKAVLEKRAADNDTKADTEAENAAGDMQAAAEVKDENISGETHLAMLTARIALVLLCVITVVVTAVFVIRNRKK